MEPLQKLFDKAGRNGLLTPLASCGMEHRTSIFADDVMLFLKASMEDMQRCGMMLETFGVFSGLRVNMRKSTVIPVRCSQDQIEGIVATLGCALGSFPCKYLGLPLTLRKQSAAQLQYLVDGLGACLPSWRASALPKSGRLLLVMSVLSAMPLHAMMALDLPARTINTLNKII
ncbi:uncharacterized protein [Aegilops tauschii subsp. strangulata]|uniref:uncharacterized protein n=1 Tax=Aegilops tauschii subsp. strangulata TaxID=200361 RepID=UPI003CC846CD